MPDATPISGIKKGVDAVFNWRALQAIIGIVGASWAVITPILIAAYCNRFSIPFFEAIDYLGGYTNYLVLAISIETGMLAAYVLLPSTISYYRIPQKIRDRFLYRKYESRKWGTFLANILSAAYICWPGLLMILVYHYFVTWKIIFGEYYDRVGGISLLTVVGAIVNLPLAVCALRGAYLAIKGQLKRRSRLRRSPLRSSLGIIQLTSLLMVVAYFVFVTSLGSHWDLTADIIAVVFLPFFVFTLFYLLIVVPSQNLLWLLGCAIGIWLLLLFVWPGPSTHMAGILRFLNSGGQIWVKVHFIHEKEGNGLNRALMENLAMATQGGTAGVFPLVLLTKERVYVQTEDAEGCSDIQKFVGQEPTNCTATIGIPASAIAAVNTFSHSQFTPAKP